MRVLIGGRKSFYGSQLGYKRATRQPKRLFRCDRVPAACLPWRARGAFPWAITATLLINTYAQPYNMWRMQRLEGSGVLYTSTNVTTTNHSSANFNTTNIDDSNCVCECCWLATVMGMVLLMAVWQHVFLQLMINNANVQFVAEHSPVLLLLLNA